MKKYSWAIALISIFNFGFSNSQAQLLYRISGNGLEKPSYIVGTYHLAPASFADSIPGLREAFAATEQVYGEVDMLETLKPENAAKLQAAMMLPEGTTISSLLSKEQMERLFTIWAMGKANQIRPILEDEITGRDIAACDKTAKRLEGALGGLKSALADARKQFGVVFNN